jgi:phosphatidylglycerophosphate synthase
VTATATPSGAGGTQETYRQTLARLGSAQKAVASGAPAYSVLVNRPVGRHLAAWAYRRGMTPNGVTAVSAGFTFTGIAVIATVAPAWWTGVAVWLLLAVGYAFDSADGQVARLRGGGSLAGEWLDHVVDSLKIVTLHLAVVVMAYRFLDVPGPTWLLVPVGFTAVATVSFFAQILNDQLRRVHTARTGESVVRRPASRLRQLLVLPTDYGVLCLVFVLLAVPTAFLWVYSLLFLATAGHLALALAKWFRDMRALDSTQGRS